MTEEERRPVRLLVFGTSTSFGAGLAEPQNEAWPRIVEGALAARFGKVECIVRWMVPDLPGSAAYVDAQLRRYEPDFVVLQATAVGLTLRTVPFRIANLLGRRAGGYTDRFIHGFDSHVVRRYGRARRINHALHWTARHVIGVDTRGRYRPIVDGYLSAIARLARVETAASVVVGTGQPHSSVAGENPKCLDAVARFNAELRAACRARRIPWVDHDEDGLSPAAHDGQFVDGLHKNAGFHRDLAARVLAALDMEGATAASSALARPSSPELSTGRA